MCWFFIVIKLLILKILLAGLMGLTTASRRYDYGYHPSAEEFDNLLRETRRTWTHDLLKTQRDRELMQQQQQQKNEARHFVPKFNYENVERKFNNFIPNPYKNPFKQRHDLQTSSTLNKNPIILQNIGSSLEFTYFSEEIPKPFYNNNNINNNNDENEINNKFTRQPTLATTDIKPVSSSAFPEINLKPIAKPDILTTNHKYSVNNLYKNNSLAQFPIYFTNPATGIVYAITEMGKSEQQVTRKNGTIPIFITKEQYERDINQLRKEYENNCQNNNNNKKYPLTSFSQPTIKTTTTTTTSRPQIIRLHKPTTSSIIATKFSTPLKKPSPVVVKTELTVKDKKPTARPLRKKKNKSKNRRKNKKSKPPGNRNHLVATTITPVSPQQPQGPKIIIGSRATTRKPFTNTEKLSTQLEKPNFEPTIFSNTPLITEDNGNTGNLSPNLYFKNHDINKRSVKIKSEQHQNLLNENSNFRNHNINKRSVKIKSAIRSVQNQNLLNENSNLYFKNHGINKRSVKIKSAIRSMQNQNLFNENLVKSTNFKTVTESLNKLITNFKNFTNKIADNLLKSTQKITEENMSKSNTNNFLKLTKENLVKSTRENLLTTTITNPKKSLNEKSSYLTKENTLKSSTNNLLKLTKENLVKLTKEHLLTNTISNPKKSLSEKSLKLTKENSLKSSTNNLLKLTTENLVKLTKEHLLTNTITESFGRFDKNSLSTTKENLLNLSTNNLLTSTKGNLVKSTTENVLTNTSNKSNKSKKSLNLTKENLLASSAKEYLLKKSSANKKFSKNSSNFNKENLLKNSSTKENLLKNSSIKEIILTKLTTKENLLQLNTNNLLKSSSYNLGKSTTENLLTNTSTKSNKSISKKSLNLTKENLLKNASNNDIEKASNEENLFKSSKNNLLTLTSVNLGKSTADNLLTNTKSNKSNKSLNLTKENLLKSSSTEENLLKNFSIKENLLKKLSAKNIFLENSTKENLLKSLSAKLNSLETSINKKLFKNSPAKENLLKNSSAQENLIKNSSDKENLLETSTKKKLLKNSSAKEHFLKDSSTKENLLKDSSAKENLLKNSSAKENLLESSTKKNLLKYSSAKEHFLKDSSTKENLSKNSSVKENLIKNSSTKGSSLYNSSNFTKENVLNKSSNSLEENLLKTSSILRKENLQTNSNKNLLKNTTKFINTKTENLKNFSNFNPSLQSINLITETLTKNLVNKINKSTKNNLIKKSTDLPKKTMLNNKTENLQNVSIHPDLTKNLGDKTNKYNKSSVKEDLPKKTLLNTKAENLQNFSNHPSLNLNYLINENITTSLRNLTKYLIKNTNNFTDLKSLKTLSDLITKTLLNNANIENVLNSTKNEFSLNHTNNKTTENLLNLIFINLLKSSNNLLTENLLKNSSNELTEYLLKHFTSETIENLLKNLTNYSNEDFLNNLSLKATENLLKNLNNLLTENLLNYSTNNTFTNSLKHETFNLTKVPVNRKSYSHNLIKNFSTKNLLKSKTKHIMKRSVNNKKPPKFIKKSINSTTENLLKNSTNFYTENMLKNFTNSNTESLSNYTLTERSLKSANKHQRISTKTTNFTSSLTKNSTNRFTNNSKLANNNKFLTNLNYTEIKNNLNNSLLITTGKVKSPRIKKKFQNSRNRTIASRKKKRIHKNHLNLQQISNLHLNRNSSKNKTNSSNLSLTTPRTIKQGLKKLAYKIAFNKGNKNSKAGKEDKEETEYDFFNFGAEDDDDEDDTEEEDDEEYDDDYEDDDEDEDEDNDEKESENYENLEYDQPPQSYTTEAGLSVEDLKEKITHENSSSAEDEADFGALEEEKFEYKNPTLDYEESNLKTTTTNSKKRIRRRPAQLKSDDDYEDDDGENSISSNLGGFFRMIFYPIQVVMGSVMDTFVNKETEEEPVNPYTQYTSYHNTLKQQSSSSSSDEYYDDDEDYDANDSSSSSLSSWLTTLFGLNRRNKKIGSTTVAPVQRPKPTNSPGWLQSWFGYGANDRISTDTASTEVNDDSEYDKWFASWFGDTKPKARKRTTTTTSTTTQLPQVPILTIVDPMRNPQNWIGILASHIINHTSTTTQNPLKDMWAKATSTTTENPEIPRKISYDKYQIWRLKPQDDTQVKALEEYKKSEDGIKLQWLKGPSLRGLTDVLVPPKMLVDFQASLTFELIDHEVLIFDVGKAISYEQTKEDYFFTTTTKNPKKHQQKYPTPPTMTWHKYYEYDDIIKYLETMRMRFPQLVELIHIGRSYEGRPLVVMKIESKEAAAVNSAHYPAHQRIKLRHKKRIGLANAVFIEAGTHGMEWIGPATATWIINELLRVMKKNSTDDQSFIRNTTWYIMPVLNPDGYVYSHEYDRFWKKSRSRHVTRPSGIINSAMTWLQKKRAKEKVCFGVDLDRNWHYQWGKRGSSKSACNEFYAGPSPFSEPETKALSEFLMDYRTQIKLFISMQAYGQIISYPYKANTTYDSERLDDLLDVAMVGTDGLRKKGSKSRYKIDSTNDLVENRSGCSDAFAAYEASIPFSYTIQLADNGVHGYLLPSASIESTAKDSFEIITGMLDYI